MIASDWFLEPSERGNPASLLDSRHLDGRAWTSGNHVRALIHGATYFAALKASVQQMRRGDLLMFTDWRGDPDESLDGEGTEVGALLCNAATAGVLVRGLVWRSHLDTLQFSEKENRHLGEEVHANGGICLLDMRVRPGGSHHQKFVVLRHVGRPELDTAFVGGIDLCHSRRDDAAHAGDSQRQQMAAVYGNRPPWHDVQLQVRGPVVGDIETVFRERWEDPALLSRNPFHLVRDQSVRVGPERRKLPNQLPDPPPCGAHGVQLLRTYPVRRPRYPFAPVGERSVARGIIKALGRARRLIYVEDQYLWAPEVAAQFSAALEAQPSLLLVAVLPLHPDQDGRFSRAPNLVGRYEALRMLQRAGRGRVAVYGLENHEGTPVYVHAKVRVIDDEWATVGSDNLNRRSWTHDSELSCAVVDHPFVHSDERRGRGFGLALRLALAREHLDRSENDDRDLEDPGTAFAAFRSAAADLDAWHAHGRQGRRPPGRLRSNSLPDLSWISRTWSWPLYRTIFDPDGRTRFMRDHGRF